MLPIRLLFHNRREKLGGSLKLSRIFEVEGSSLKVYKMTVHFMPFSAGGC